LQHEYLPWQSSFQGLKDCLCVFSTYVQTLGTLCHAFETTIIEKEVAFEEALNVKTKVMRLKNELRQAQTQA